MVAVHCPVYNRGCIGYTDTITAIHSSQSHKTEKSMNIQIVRNRLARRITGLVALPLAAYLVLSVIEIRLTLNEAETTRIMRDNMRIMAGVSPVIHHLQRERGRSSMFLTGTASAEQLAASAGIRMRSGPAWARCWPRWRLTQTDGAGLTKA